MVQSATVPPRTASRPTGALLVGSVGSAAVVLLGNVNVTPGEQGGLVPAIVCSLLCAVVAVLLFVVVLPRAARPVRTVVILGVLAVVSLVVFWSGITPLIAAAAFAVPTGAGPSRAAGVWRVLSAVAAVLAVGWSVAGQLLDR